MGSAAVVVVPSLWFEGYPLVIAESLAAGTPVLTLQGGSPGSIIGPDVGWSVDKHDLGQALSELTPESAARKRAAARRQYERENSPDRAFESLNRIYEEVARAA